MKGGRQAYQMLQDGPLEEKIQAPTRQQVSCLFLKKKEAQIVTSLISPISNASKSCVFFSSLSTPLLQVLSLPKTCLFDINNTLRPTLWSKLTGGTMLF